MVDREVDGLDAALDAALGGDARGAAKKPVPKLSGIELLRAVGDALEFDGPPPHDELLDKLRVAENALGFAIDDVPVDIARKADAAPHVLVGWMIDADAIVELYAVPESVIDARQRAALEFRVGIFAGAVDCETAAQWTAANRIMAALGDGGGLEGDDFYERYVDEGEQEGMWSDDERPDSRAELDAAWRAWTAYRVKQPADLDRRFVRSTSLTLAM